MPISYILHRFNTEKIATQINMFPLPLFMSCALHFKKIALEVPQGATRGNFGRA